MSKKNKIFPRNATAKSHSQVIGNPVTSRPESGVDNSYPGLEFDQRNLDKRFFPGMEFEFHSSALLRSVNENLDQEIKDVNLEKEIQNGLVLLAVNGCFGDKKKVNRTVVFDKDNGLNDWRMIHDLEEGPLAIAIIPYKERIERDQSILAFEYYIDDENNDVFTQRNDKNELIHIFLRGKRARYLNENGVIDPAEYKPGDLTRSLCSPWQYDFALCGCFYWASNKPDMVKKDADSPQLSSFQRKKNIEDSPVKSIVDYDQWEKESSNNISEFEMINEWENLPAVFNEIETDSIEIQTPIKLSEPKVFSLKTIKKILRELATVEHGLMIEYLYAYYSINTKAYEQDKDNRDRVNASADTVLSIAIDEMRHLRWVNEILLLLGEESELGRFDDMPKIGGPDRVIKHEFSLEPLTPDRLKWFIEVEAPSDQLDIHASDDTIDGMYTQLLLSISQNTDFTENKKQELLRRIKAIIDEGHDHYLRFLKVQQLLEDLDPVEYLQLKSIPKPLLDTESAFIYERLVDSTYHDVLNFLKMAFVEKNSKKMDKIFTAAREFMYNLDEAAKNAIENGGSPLFEMPLKDDAANKSIDNAGVPLSEFIDKIIIPDFKIKNSNLFNNSQKDQDIQNNMIKRLESARDQLKLIE